MQKSTHNLDWASVVLTAEAAQEPFEEVMIVTARSKFAEQAYGIAYEMYRDVMPDDLTEQNVKQTALLLIGTNKLFVQESVDINDNGITVTVNAPVITDEHSLYALDLIAKAMDQLDEQHGTVYFGEELRYSVAEVLDML